MATRFPPGFEPIARTMPEPEAQFVYLAKDKLRISVGVRKLLQARQHVQFAISRERRRMILVPCDGTDPNAYRIPKAGVMEAEPVHTALVNAGAVVGTRYPVRVIDGYATVDFSDQAA